MLLFFLLKKSSFITLPRESASKSATRSAPSTAQPIHHGSRTTARLPCRFLPGSRQTLHCCVFIHSISHMISDAFCASCQPQVYGYDDLQMLQTRIPLVSLKLLQWGNKKDAQQRFSLFCFCFLFHIV